MHDLADCPSRTLRSNGLLTVSPCSQCQVWGQLCARFGRPGIRRCVEKPLGGAVGYTSPLTTNPAGAEDAPQSRGLCIDHTRRWILPGQISAPATAALAI